MLPLHKWVCVDMCVFSVCMYIDVYVLLTIKPGSCTYWDNLIFITLHCNFYMIICLGIISYQHIDFISYFSLFVSCYSRGGKVSPCSALGAMQCRVWTPCSYRQNRYSSLLFLFFSVILAALGIFHFHM